MCDDLVDSVAVVSDKRKCSRTRQVACLDVRSLLMCACEHVEEAPKKSQQKMDKKSRDRTKPKKSA